MSDGFAVQSDSLEPKYLAPGKAGAFIGVATQTLAKWRCGGDGPPFIKLGRKVVYDKADMIAWMSSRRVTSTSAKRAIQAREA